MELIQRTGRNNRNQRIQAGDKYQEGCIGKLFTFTDSIYQIYSEGTGGSGGMKVQGERVDMMRLAYGIAVWRNARKN